MTHTLRSLCTPLARATRCLAVFAAVLLAAPALAAGVNVAAQSNGGVATASTVYSTGYPVAAVNNGDRKGLNWGSGGGWNDSTASVWPDWVQITFNGQKTINAIHVFTLQDSYASPAEPTAAMVFTRYGITAFDIQYWNGTAWVTVPGGSISGNNAVWRQVSFPAITTDRIRVQVNASLERYSRITEIEAYDTAGPTNVPPTVSLTSPVNGASYTAPATINLSATASDSDGSIASVKFYRQGADQILIGNGTLTGGSYTYTWSNVAAGSYSLTAKATDNAGAVTTSTAVNISVTSPPPVAAAGVYYIYADHLNTPRVATDGTNKVVWRWDSDAFGTSTANEDPDGDGVKFTYNPRFPGQYFDKETGLHYNYFRDYEPSTGRYVQSDPIGLAGGLNTYGYALSNPVHYFDSDGLEVRFICRNLSGLAKYSGKQHCFVHVTCPKEGWSKTFSLFGADGVWPSQGYKAQNDSRDNPSSPNNKFNKKIDPKQCFADECQYEKEIEKRFQSFPRTTVPYSPMGPNSNSFAGDLATGTPIGAQLPQGAPNSNLAPGIGMPHPSFP